MTKKVIILGGGYSGLACALSLSANKDFSIRLVDQRPFFLETVKLHRSVHQPLSKFQIPYENIKASPALNLLCTKWIAQTEQMQHWQSNKKIKLGGQDLSFDYLVLATGSRDIALEQETDSDLRGKELISLAHIKNQGAQRYLEDCLNTRAEKVKSGELRISVVGGGATAIQFLFEICAWLKIKSKERKQKIKLQLLHSQKKLLTNFPDAFHEYCHAKIKKEEISYYPQSCFLRQEAGQLIFQRADKEGSALPSDLSFLFCGAAPYPHKFCTDAYGRVIWEGKLLENIYSAGDCSDYSLASSGLNSRSGQAALRKGRLVASNIIRSAKQPKEAKLLAYLYPEMGAFVSLGDWDGIGWLFVPFNILRGKAAFLAKEAIESQFRLLLSGIDSYVDL